MDFSVGQFVRVRGLEWQVLDLERLGAQQLLHLRCVGGDLQGLDWDILHPFEPVTAIPATVRTDRPRTLADWRLHHTAGLLDQVFGPDALVATAPGRLRIEPYQLVPLMRALELPRPRLLLADDVGLGKTIQAGLIATELIARRQAHRVLVVTPAGPLLLQWQQELRQRFGLRFTTIADSAALETQRRTMELGGNPFAHIALTLVTLDFAKQERVLQELERASWDIAIIDEAHHCISAGPGSDRDATLRRRLAEVVARHSDGLLLLTATPHDGNDPHFCSLIELLDPSLVDGRGGLAGPAYRRHVVRRLKSHIRDPATGAPVFRERVVLPVRVELRGAALAPVRAFHQALAALVAPRLRRASGRSDATDALAFVGLLKRSVSTISACVSTLGVVAERYRSFGDDPAQVAALHRERARALRAWRRRTLRFGTLDAAEEGDAERLEAEHIATDLHAQAGATADSLQSLIALGQAAARHDPKLAALLREIRAIRAQQPGANILIYTEYADSQRAAAEAMRGARGIAGEVLTISGLDTEAARSRAAERCAEEDGIILLSTDSLAEGLNLQQRCHHLIHLDLPYNPNRLEQRNGRIDRYGQRHAPEIRYLYLAGTFEERLLLRLISKYEKARARLAAMPATLGVTADAAALDTGLVAGFAEEQARLFEEAPPIVRMLDQEAADAGAEAYRDLLHEIDRAFAGYDRDAVRHGWFAGQGVHADAAQLAAAEAAWRRGEQELGCIDLADFVAATLAAETGRDADPEHLTVPEAWTGGLATLPGYDAASRTLHIARSRAQLRDANGAALAFLGRAHPLVRRAVARMRRAENLVAVARGDQAVGQAALLTYTLELSAGRQTVLRRVIAVLLPRAGRIAILEHPAQWLRFADPARECRDAAAMHEQFAAWLPARQQDADAAAREAARRLEAAFAATHHRRMQSERDALHRWLDLRAGELCGPALRFGPDLFGAEPTGPAWHLPAPPLERLAAFALDPGNPPVRRRAAHSVVELFRRRDADRMARATLSPPLLRPLGVLLLVPAGDAG